MVIMLVPHLTARSELSEKDYFNYMQDDHLLDIILILFWKKMKDFSFVLVLNHLVFCFVFFVYFTILACLVLLP